ncbi:MAG: hypothetical protein ACTHOO_11700 [Alcanivorax sp.]
MRLVILILIVGLFAPVCSYAESVPSPQVIDLLQYCSPIDSDETDYPVKREMAEHILNEHPDVFAECYADSDCVIAAGACGDQVAIAYMAKSCYERAAMIYGATINCVSSPHHETEMHAVCVDRHCRIGEKK